MLSVIVVASIGFVGTMFDNFFAFGAQLLVTDRSRFRRVSAGLALGVGALVGMAAGLGTLLAPVPVRWVGLLCVAPFAFAVHTWRHRAAPHEQYRRGALTTFAVTLGLGGDNLAVWIPLLRASGASRDLFTVATFVAWEAVFLFSANRLANHPRVATWGNAHAPTIVPFVYVALGVLILFECHTI